MGSGIHAVINFLEEDLKNLKTGDLYKNDGENYQNPRISREDRACNLYEMYMIHLLES